MCLEELLVIPEATRRLTHHFKGFGKNLERLFSPRNEVLVGMN
jgi:hypothetical protein